MEEAVIHRRLKPRFKLPRLEFVESEIAQLNADLEQLQKLRSVLTSKAQPSPESGASYAD